MYQGYICIACMLGTKYTNNPCFLLDVWKHALVFVWSVLCSCSCQSRVGVSVSVQDLPVAMGLLPSQPSLINVLGSIWFNLVQCGYCWLDWLFVTLYQSTKVRELTIDFANSRYKTCLKYLADLKGDLQLDMYLHKHLDVLYKMVEDKCLMQWVAVITYTP